MKVIRYSFILLAGILLGSLVSCNKGIGTEEVSDGHANVYFDINRGIAAESMTKSASAPSDDNLGKVQVLLFDHASGVLAYSASKTLNSVTGTVEVSDVPMNIAFDYRVVANVSADFSNAASVTDIDNYVVALKDYASNSVPMYAKGSKTFSSETSAGKSVSASLERAASRIEIQKVQADFTGTSAWIAGQSAAVTGMYIYKAPGAFRLGLTDVPAASKVYWHNGSYKAADATALGAIAPFVGEAISTANDISNNGSYSAAHWFLCSPEGAYTASPAENGSFFTIEVTIGGIPYYYGVPLSSMGLKPNYKYVISNVKLTKLGNINPPGIIDEQQASFAINVEPWQEDPNFNGAIEF